MRSTATMGDTLPPFLATDPEVYEHFMGRWSARLAEPFLEFAGVTPGSAVLDVGCGTGTITLASAERGAKTIGLDASESYLQGARRLRSHPDVEYVHGDACHLQYASASFDACVSALVIDVVPTVDLFAAEMRRITRPGGVVACATFDFWGGSCALDLVLDTGAVLDDGIRPLRAQIRARPIVWAHGQADLWRQTGLVEVVESRSCSASTTPTSRTTGAAGRPVRPGLPNALWLCPPIRETRSSSTFEPATWLAYRMSPDRSPPWSEPCEGPFPRNDAP